MSGYGESLSKEEKLKIIKALEEDLEFRYAVAGALGILEFLKRLDSIEKNVEKIVSIVVEHSKRLEELTKTVQGHSKILEEHSKRIEEHSKRIEELTKTIQEHSRRIEELTRAVQGHSKILEEHSKRIEEHSKRIEELTDVVTELVRRVSALEQVTGALTEASVARYVYEDIAREISLKGSRILKRVRNARLDEVDIDLLVESNESVYVVEVKVKPKHGDVGSLLSKIDVVRKYYPGKEVVGVLAGVWIGSEVESYAREKGVITYTY